MWRNVMVLGWLVTLGCSDGQRADAVAFVAQFNEAYCAHYLQCGLIDDVARCQEAGYTGWQLRETDLNALDRGAATVNAAAVARCLALVADLPCGDVEATLTFSHLWDCTGVFVGNVADGGACATNVECRSGGCDVYVDECDGACCAGACDSHAYPAPAHLGESCAHYELCVDGLYCASNFLCSSRTAVGACERDAACIDGAYCAAGQCRRRPQLGEPCSASAPCADLGAACASDSHTCVALGKRGDACSATAPCMALYRCDAGGHCAATPTTGLPCGDAGRCVGDDNYCEAAEGTTPTCVPLHRDGEPCSGDFSCMSHNCPAGAELRCAPDLPCQPRAPSQVGT